MIEFGDIWMYINYMVGVLFDKNKSCLVMTMEYNGNVQAPGLTENLTSKSDHLHWRKVRASISQNRL